MINKKTLIETLTMYKTASQVVFSKEFAPKDTATTQSARLMSAAGKAKLDTSAMTITVGNTQPASGIWLDTTNYQ